MGHTWLVKVLSERDSATPKEQHVSVMYYLIWVNYATSGQATEDRMQLIKDTLEKGRQANDDFLWKPDVIQYIWFVQWED